MRVRSGHRLLRGLVLPAAALALVAGVSGCKAQAGASAQETSSPAAADANATGASAGASGAPAPPATPVAATSQAPGPGTLSVSVTSPVTRSGTVPVPVSCTAGLAYRAAVTGADISGDQVSFTVVIARYRGPGRYPAVVAVTLRQASGVVTTVAGVPKVPATISSGGGSFTVSATGTAGRIFTGSLSWTCGT